MNDLCDNFTLSFHLLLQVFSFPMNDLCDYFDFEFMTWNGIVEMEVEATTYPFLFVQVWLFLHD